MDGDQEASFTSTHVDLQTVVELTPGMAHGVADQFAGDQPTVVKRPAAVVDLSQRIANGHRRVFIARQVERQQITG